MSNDLKDFEEAVSLAVKNALIDVSKVITDKIQGFYIDTITEFYNHYEPLSYHRTEATKHASDYGFRHRRKSGKTFAIGGIEVDTKWLLKSEGGVNPYRARSVDYVFDRTFDKGIHGLTIPEAAFLNIMLPESFPKRPLSPTPKERMDKKYNNYCKKSDISKEFDKTIVKYLDKYLK